MRYPAILAAALTAAAIAAPSAATNTGSSTIIKYSDLDLATKAGQEQLERRINSAARAACGMDAAKTGTRVASTEVRRCYEQARTSVHQQVAELIARENSRG